jgi:hypothetical protein
MAPNLTTAMDLDDPNDSSLQKEEREPPKLTLFDAIILKGKSTPASVDDLSTGVPLRAEGYLWIEEPEKIRRKLFIPPSSLFVSNSPSKFSQKTVHKPNGSECVVPFQLFSYERNDIGAIAFWVLDTQTEYWIEIVPSQQYSGRYGQLIASAELKHFVTDYYLGVVAGEVEDSIMQLSWEVCFSSLLLFFAFSLLVTEMWKSMTMKEANRIAMKVWTRRWSRITRGRCYGSFDR